MFTRSTAARTLIAVCGWALWTSAPLGGRHTAPVPQTTTASSQDDAAQASPAVKGWAVLMQSMTAIDAYLSAGELSGIHSEDSSIAMAVTALSGERTAARADARDRIPQLLAAFGRKLADLHAAADAFDRPGVEARRKEVVTAYDTLEGYYGEETLAPARRLAARYMCPMHPDVRGARTERCGKCGMELDQPVRIPLFSFGGTLATQTVQAAVRIPHAPQAGQPVDGVLTLTTFGRPVLITDLRVVHTERIHLLVIDPGLTDYHHLHPRPTATPGEYAFTFTPRRTSPYRAWADIRTTTTGLQEYAMADVGSTVTSEKPADTTVRLQSAAEGLRFELTPGVAQIAVGHPARMRLRVTDAAGKPFSDLEPVMGTFAHVVGFSDDYRTVLHTHPTTSGPVTPDRRGGPELELQWYATRAGFYRVFVQVQARGASIFAPFGIDVAPSARTP